MFRTANDFSLSIENRVADSGQTHLEAVLEFCAKHGLEPSDISNKINRSLKDKLEQNFRDLGFLERRPQLEF